MDLFLERQPKERMMQKIGQQIRINRSKIKDTSDTNSDFDDLSNAIRSGYYLKEGLCQQRGFLLCRHPRNGHSGQRQGFGWRIGEIRKLMVSQDMNLQLCAASGRRRPSSLLYRCAPGSGAVQKSTAATSSRPLPPAFIRSSVLSCAIQTACCWA